MDLPNPSKLVPAWLLKILGSAFGVVCLMLLAMFAWNVYITAKHEVKEVERDRKMEIMMTNFQILHEQAVLRDLVAEKLPKLPVDTQAKIAFEIYEGARRIPNCPSWMIMALIEKESAWNGNAVSAAGAIGYMQLMPGTALGYARGMGITITSLDQIREPIMNIRIGIQVLLDNYRAAVMQGKSPEGDFTRALWTYNGGGEPYARLVMEKASYYQKRLQAPMAGKLTVPKPE